MAAYKLKLPPHWKIHPRNSHLHPPDLIDDEEQYEIEKVLDSRTRQWKGWTREHNSWVAESEMGSAQEAIADYEKKTQRVRRLDPTKIITNPDKALTMILDHEYKDNGDAYYLAQRHDGTQKWVKNSGKDWKKFLDEYWNSQADSQYDFPKEEP
ncbi:uncharacterized protein ARMOST_21915 [Armillaria ostoyae]|uniref:Chromo domain-containing protein n=1 Tax=Armillaria ostoyae TaxID=47428 RepID=A0A284SBI3_ARMOS|nr:uncharacterized protein ARMOST_07547 [Armillaria ostoyae]SJL18329.1 uncharacterized protein ARMOST_21915 [Armillaria ostoyae]